MKPKKTKPTRRGPEPEPPWYTGPGFIVPAFIAFGILWYVFWACSDDCDPTNYRIVTDGQNFKLEERVWPFWVDTAHNGWPILSAVEQARDNTVAAARAKRAYKAPDWIEVTPAIRHRFTNEPPKAVLMDGAVFQNNVFYIPAE